VLPTCTRAKPKPPLRESSDGQKPDAHILFKQPMDLFEDGNVKTGYQFIQPECIPFQWLTDAQAMPCVGRARAAFGRGEQHPRSPKSSASEGSAAPHSLLRTAAKGVGERAPIQILFRNVAFLIEPLSSSQWRMEDKIRFGGASIWFLKMTFFFNLF